jgi:methionine synthase I (cobalamin-dependent)
MRFLEPAKGRLVMDGAMGTELIERGLDVRADVAERWVLDRPDDVAAIHRAYVEAGAQAIQTCTFGALRTRLAAHDLQDRVADVCNQGVELARRAAEGLPVLASLGPTGLAGRGSTDVAKVRAEVAEAARHLALADAIHLETQYAPDELVAAAAGVRDVSGLPLIVSITVTTGASGLETPHGVPIDRMVRALRDAGPDAVGVNCSLDADRIRSAVERLVDAGLGPVFARPQARVSEKCATGRSRELPARFAERAARLFELGAVAVGGCCGTSPASIAALSALVRGETRDLGPPTQQEVTR